ncbi:LysR family transcriptional regulator [Alsobacter sp. SYSU BS001988]
MFNLKLIEAFYWVAKLRNFHAAAERMRLSQPSVTYRIKELERQLGRSLLIRSGAPVRLTPQGQAFFADAERLLMLVQDMQHQLRAGQTVTGLLRIGVMDAFAAVCLPELLRDLAEQHPGLDVSVAVDLSHTLTVKLAAGELDVAVVSSPPILSGLRYDRLGAQPVGWISTPGLAPSIKEPSSVGQQRIFITPPPSGLGTITIDWFRECGLEPPTFSMCNSMSAIVRLVSAGAGIGIMPLRLVDDAIAAGRLRHLDHLLAVKPQDIFITAPSGVLDMAIPVTTDAIRSVARRHAFSDESRTSSITPA